MINIYNAYLILLCLSVVITLSFAGYIWIHFWYKLRVRTARIFAFLVFSVSIWAFGSAFALQSSTPAHIYFWEQFKYIGILLIPVTLFIFCLQWTGRDKKMSPFKYGLLFILPALFMILIFTDPLHHFWWKEFHIVSFGPYLFDRVVHGIGWWVFLGYNLIFLAISVLLLGSVALNLRYNYRRHAAVLLVGILFPLCSNLAFAFGISPLLVDITPSMFIVTSALYVWGLLKFQMIDIIPIAHTTVFMDMKDLLLVTDYKDRVLDVNKAALEILGLKESEVMGRPVQDILPEKTGKEKKFESIKEIRTEVEVWVREQKRWFDLKIDPLLDSHSRMIGHVISLRDITGQKEAEKKIKAALKEKEVLLNEVHHRVKNNMQIISSLLRLQSSQIKNKELKAVFDTSQSRIQTMALIHEILYREKDFSRVSFGAYIQKLVSYLFRAYNVDTNRIKLRTDLADTFLNLKKAIPCGLIINELVSNSIVHAFSQEGTGMISVSFKAKNGERLELVVRDNGKGLPATIDFKNSETLGLQLVNDLVSQIGGTIELEKGVGMAIRIEFARN